jgi:hypothetical protein
LRTPIGVTERPLSLQPADHAAGAQSASICATIGRIGGRTCAISAATVSSGLLAATRLQVPGGWVAM